LLRRFDEGTLAGVPYRRYLNSSGDRGVRTDVNSYMVVWDDCISVYEEEMKEMFDAMIGDAWLNLIERESISQLQPQSIYDLYAVEFLRHKGIGEDSEIFDVLQAIKNNILLGYKPVIQAQLAKYADKKRYIGAAPDSEVTPYLKLQDEMGRTRRSDMTTHNTQWEALIQLLLDLRSTDDVSKMLYAIDRIFNLTHNTHSKILDKFPNKDELFQAFEFCKNAKSINDYKGKVSRRVSSMLSGVNEEYAPGYSEYEKETSKGQYLQPAFLDKDTGKIYPTKGFHNLNELPKIVRNYEEGFMTLDHKFLTREQAKLYTGSFKKELVHA
jgi:hypothetical protein